MRYILYLVFILVISFIFLYTTQPKATFLPTHEELLSFQESEFEMGQWSKDAQALTFLKNDPNATWNIWIPKQNHEYANGTMRAIVQLGNRPDFTLFLRYQSDQPTMPSGYGLSLEKSTFRLYRWDNGYPRDIATKQKIKSLPSEIEVLFTIQNHWMNVFIYNAKNQKLITSFQSTDSRWTKGKVAVRAYKEQDVNTKIKLLGYSPSDTNLTANDSSDIFGTEGIAIVRGLEPSTLKNIDGIKWIEQVNNDQRVIFSSRKALKFVQSKGGEIIEISSGVPYRYKNSSYAKARVELQEGRYNPLTNTAYRDNNMSLKFLQVMHEQYPDITAIKSIGKTRGGNDIWAMRITDNPKDDENEPMILLNAAHHGSELISIEFALDSIRWLLENSNEERGKKYISEFDIWVVPMVNPDGNSSVWNVDHNIGRKNRWDVNQNGVIEFNEGVDLNRNYPFQWGTLGEKGSSSRYNHSWFRGLNPGSEPEAKAMMSLSNIYHPAVVFSWHTSGNMIISPYTIDDVPIPKPDIPWEIAEKLVYNLPKAPSKSRAMVVKRNMYSVDGTDQDWHYNRHGSIAYILEGPYHNPGTDLREKSIEYMRIILKRMFNHLHKGPRVYGTVIDHDGIPLQAVVSLEENKTYLDEEWTSRMLDGRYDRVLSKNGSYTLIVEANGYQTYRKKISVSGPTKANVTLSPL
jgi:hypothetical protein